MRDTVGMRTRGIPLMMSALWFVLAVAVLGLSYYALTQTPYPGLWWGGLAVAMVLLAMAGLWALAALTGWVQWAVPARRVARERD